MNWLNQQNIPAEMILKLVNSVQRHSKYNSAYCLREDDQGNQYCRFHYPFALESRTYLRLSTYERWETL